MPLQQILDKYVELDRRRSWVVVCQIGQRSDLATQFLRSKGYEVSNLDGGLERWLAAGYPLVMTTGVDGTVVDGWAQDLVWEERATEERATD
jgi:3-mercaptopyruvate sulfurtransferase SseA